MKKTRILRTEEGFTLIEIIAVLVILGILAAVAVPKYFDLQTKAREKAIYTAVSEIKVRINQHFASRLLQGDTMAGISFKSSTVLDNPSDLGPEFYVSSWQWTSGSSVVSFVITYPVGDSNPSSIQQTVNLPKFKASP